MDRPSAYHIAIGPQYRTGGALPIGPQHTHAPSAERGTRVCACTGARCMHACMRSGRGPWGRTLLTMRAHRTNHTTQTRARKCDRALSLSPPRSDSDGARWRAARHMSHVTQRHTWRCDAGCHARRAASTCSHARPECARTLPPPLPCARQRACRYATGTCMPHITSCAEW